MVAYSSLLLQNSRCLRALSRKIAPLQWLKSSLRGYFLKKDVFLASKIRCKKIVYGQNADDLLSVTCVLLLISVHTYGHNYPHITAITTDKEPSLLNRFFSYKKNLFKLKGEEMGIK